MVSARMVAVDRITLLLMGSRFTIAISRLSLGPLMPLLTKELGFTAEDKPALLSSYSFGYLMTQLLGGFANPMSAISGCLGASSLLLFGLSLTTNKRGWAWSFFAMGLVSGPLFPAGSAAISFCVPLENRTSAAAFVDAAAAFGTAVAGLTPILAYQAGWAFVYRLMAVSLACIFVVIRSVPIRMSVKTKQSFSKANLSYSVLNAAAWCVYICNSTDNFTKYSLNAWASTLFTERHGASPYTVGTLLALQEVVGVISRMVVGMYARSSSKFSNKERVSISAIVSVLQGLALSWAFSTSSIGTAVAMMTASASLTGLHSLGFRAMYFEVSPPQYVGSISGVGNTVASTASALGPALLGVCEEYSQVAFVLRSVSIVGSLLALFLVFAREISEGIKKFATPNVTTKATRRRF